MTSEFAVTDKRLLSTELLVYQIEAIAVDQPVMGNILHYRSITITGTDGVREELHNIAHPLEFRRAVHCSSVREDERSIDR
jgi:hypothetical protein